MADHFQAKRGFIAVTSRIRQRYMLHTGSYTQITISVGIVSSVARDGTVKRVASLNNGADATPSDWDTCLLLDPARLADPDAFLAECKRRLSTDADKWQPFADVNEVRALARQFAKAA